MRSVTFVLLAGITTAAFAQSLFAAEPAKAKENVLYSFCPQQNCPDGAGPWAAPIEAKDKLYGTTVGGGTGGNNGGGSGGGAAFVLDPKTGVETVLYSFCSQQPGCKDGLEPEAGLIDLDGTLYGTTFGGGVGVGNCASNGCGTAFSINPSTGVEKVIHSFCSQQNCTDGQNPQSPVIKFKGKLFGTTQTGGSYQLGTVYELDPATGVETAIHSFGDGGDGRYPLAGLLEVGGLLYGTTPEGGSNGHGTIFVINPKKGTETVLHSFGNGTDGVAPDAALTALNGTLYGTTAAGGTYGYGTVFALDPKSGEENVLYSFCGQQNCADGANPTASLTDMNGTLYGTTFDGGANTNMKCNGGMGCGTIFALDPKSHKEKVAYSFCSLLNCADGAVPYGGLINVRGALYGATDGGGAYGSGTVFQLDP